MSPRPISMPAFAPLYVPGEESVDVRWMTLSYPVERDVCERVLVSPLRAPSEPVAAAWIAEFRDAAFHSEGVQAERRPPYLQGGVSISCLHDGLLSAYAVATFVGGLNYGILGRELFGLPKKQVRDVMLQEDGDRLCYAITDAAGVELLSGAADGLQPAGDVNPAPEWFAAHLTAKLIPSAEGTGYDVAKLVRIPWSFTGNRDTYHGTGSFSWAHTESDPLYLLSDVGEGRVSYGRSSLSIRFGEYVGEITDLEPLGQQQW